MGQATIGFKNIIIFAEIVKEPKKDAQCNIKRLLIKASLFS
jgi:hypothetical protein